MTSTTGTKTRLDAGHGMVRTRAFKLLACLVAHALVNLQLQWPSCCVDGAAHAPTPLPPVQTAEQKRIIGQIQSTARVQSQAAKGGLLAVLASAGFKSLLAPELRPLSAAALWQRYTDELQFVEMAHGFPANNNATQNNALDLDIDIASEMSFFPNQWQLPILYPQRELQSYYSLISYLAPAAALEMGVWGYKGFTSPNPFGDIWPGGYPASLDEASDRVIYGVYNQHKLDFPNYLWGDVAMVFNNSHVGPMTILTAVDSGDWTCDCNHTFTTQLCGSWHNSTACQQFWYCNWHNATNVCMGVEDVPASQEDHNCAGWAGGRLPSGTLADNAHLPLPYADWYKSRFAVERLALLFNRILLPWSATPRMELFGLFDYYYEADIAGNVHFPEGVQFLVASFPALFGRAEGAKVRALCRKWGWALVWALGPNGNNKPVDAWQGTARVLDPAGAGRSNASVATGAAARFASLWGRVAAGITHGNASNVTYSAWWSDAAEIVGPALHLQPMRAHACANPAPCFALTAGETDCLCYV